MKIGRNDPCICGSGLKYKRCCLNKTPSIPQEVLEAFQKQRLAVLDNESKYGKGRDIIHENFEGNKFVAVGDELHFASTWKTFPDFLFDYAKRVLGEKWGNNEHAKPAGTQHPIIRWLNSIKEFKKRQVPDEDGIFRTLPSGDFSSFLHLAYDLYTLKHNSHLQRKIIERLKFPDLFQGARYELYVIATCIKAGFDITYEDEGDRSKRHVEFVATHRPTNLKIMIEAKSKHVQGLLGVEGELKKGSLPRLVPLINNALTKRGKYPLVIFVETNIDPETADKIFHQKPPNYFSKIIDKVAQEEDSGKDLFNLVVFTNNPDYFESENISEYGVTMVSVFSQNPFIMPRNDDPLKEIYNSAVNYNKIPNDFPNH